MIVSGYFVHLVARRARSASTVSSNDSAAMTGSLAGVSSGLVSGRRADEPRHAPAVS
jgi:hypothetical protein